ncbi:Flp pilus assembly protein TadD [Aquabacterium commune]|uniref:Flp pilus assembly protein TadD n=1 Tax=Aquabacterium commune TaxID=70586 RepID=A0A4R6RNN2_9BURK|nr:tetratricopeptide repeat protein [Aquabacterium commune]TDP88351.1 Flp pilus assembly protein TadD [Aquabacterium commune]
MTHRLPPPLRARCLLAGWPTLALTWVLPWTMVACAPIGPRQHDAPVDPAVCSAGLGPAENTRLAAIEQVLRDGKPYAALAQLDAMRSEAPGVQLVRADALRRIDRPHEAAALYQQLLSGCQSAQAHHGLGLLLANQGKLSEGLTHLQAARTAAPTDVRVRNDLGYALLLANRPDEARFELLTVLDLSPREPRASRNLVLLTMREGRPEKARELAASLGLDAATLERLGQQASQSQAAPPLPEPAPTLVAPPLPANAANIVKEPARP